MQNSLIQWVASRLFDRTLSPRELLTARKLVYIGLVLILFTASFLWRRYAVEPQARQLAILEENIGDVELSGRMMQLTLTGSRGVATCWLWSSAIDAQKKNQWNELEFLTRSVTKLQPHFITPWLFQSWNLAYNVPAVMDRVPDKYFYVTRGVELLWEGERQNQNHPDLRFSIGFYTQHKIAQSDQTNAMRSLFQLSMIPPRERNPARFYKKNASGGEEFNWPEFEDFCKKYPQLCRRLHDGVRMETEQEQKALFTCKTAEEVVDFLRENYNLPTIWTEENGAARQVYGSEGQARFPLLPPVRTPPAPQVLYELPDGKEWTQPERRNDPAEPPDELMDPFVVARAWYGYAQEPIPPPDELPGSTKEVEDRVLQRRPKYMATVIFRSYPCLAQSQTAHRLEQEGWYDDDKWQVRSWFGRTNGYFSDGKTKALIGPKENQPWSLLAWERSRKMWEKHGDLSRLDVSDAELKDKEQTNPQFVVEYHGNRQMTNFHHHYERAKVESEIKGGVPVTVRARKTFYNAETENLLKSSPETALREYEKPEGLDAWRQILQDHPKFREDDFIQEQSFEIQLAYQAVRKRVDPGGKLKRLREDISERAAQFAHLLLRQQAGMSGTPGAVLAAELAPPELVGRLAGGEWRPGETRWELVRDVWTRGPRRERRGEDRWEVVRDVWTKGPRLDPLINLRWSEPIPQMMAFVNGPFNVPARDPKTGEVLHDDKGNPVYLLTEQAMTAVLERKGLRRQTEPVQPSGEAPQPIPLPRGPGNP